MSTWKPHSDLMRLNAAPVGAWLDIPSDLARVLNLGLAIGRASGGAFDIGMGDAVRAWGFSPADADPQAICAAMQAPHQPAHEVLDLNGTGARKVAPLRLELNGIAKGYGLDRLAEVLSNHGIRDAPLVGIDSELRAVGLRPDGRPLTIAVEAPDRDRRAPHSILTLQDAAVATSGDFRHWVTVQGRDLSHTKDPRRGAPLLASPASVTAIATTCAPAAACATALMVKGIDAGADLARQAGLYAVFLVRDDAGCVQGIGVGNLLFGKTVATAPAFRD